MPQFTVIYSARRWLEFEAADEAAAQQIVDADPNPDDFEQLDEDTDWSVPFASDDAEPEEESETPGEFPMRSRTPWAIPLTNKQINSFKAYELYEAGRIEEARALYMTDWTNGDQTFDEFIAAVAAYGVQHESKNRR